MSTSHRGMWVLGKPCPDCDHPMYITRLTGKPFCRECWEYKSEELKEEWII